MPARGRHTLARHGRLVVPRLWVTILKLVGLTAGVVAISGAIVAGYAAYDLASRFADRSVELEDQRPAPPEAGGVEGGVDILLIGTDECEPEFSSMFGDRCSGPDAQGQLNDVNMLIDISDRPRRVTVVSFPRDLMIPMPSCRRADGSTSVAARKMQLNAAWGRGGLSCVVKTIGGLSGRSIPLAAKVSFGNVINITNAIGGVEVCIGNGGIRDVRTGLDWPAGRRTIAGMEALQFLRTRHGLAGGSDLSRISNQQQYMSSLARKLISAKVLSDPRQVYALATVAVDNITPSRSLSNPMVLAQIALAVKEVPFEDIAFVQYPVFADPDDRNRVVPDAGTADRLWAALASNNQLDITHDQDLTGGVIAQPPVTATPHPRPTIAPRVDLPENVPGQTAQDRTCSAGNVATSR
jgi:LCP family protein required for cell wall assembly